jgi:hypothetical protein
MSGFVASMMGKASRAVRASPTTWYRGNDRKSRMPSRTNSWSSTTTILVFDDTPPI